MKLVIHTQVYENYGAYDWDGEGECPQYWKAKGGSTYLVPDLTVDQALKVKDHGIPTLASLIEQRTEGFEEQIINWEIVDNDVVICEEWENPIELAYTNNQWEASDVRENNEYTFMHGLIRRSISTWTLAPKGERKNGTSTYVMHNGDVVKDSDISEYLKVRGNDGR